MMKVAQSNHVPDLVQVTCLNHVSVGGKKELLYNSWI